MHPTLMGTAKLEDVSGPSGGRGAAGSCKLVGGDGAIAQQVGVRAARGGDVPALAPPQPQERRPDQRPGARPRLPLAPRASRPGRGGHSRAGGPRRPMAAGAFRRGRPTLSGDGQPTDSIGERWRSLTPRATRADIDGPGRRSAGGAALRKRIFRRPPLFVCSYA